MDSWVIQLVVMPFHSSPAADPTSARAFGIFQVTLFKSSGSSSVKAAPSRTSGPERTGAIPQRLSCAPIRKRQKHLDFDRAHSDRNDGSAPLWPDRVAL